MPPTDPFPTTDVIKVPVIAGTGDGRLPTELHGTLLPTPGSANSNIVAIVVQPLVALLVRTIHTYLTTLVGLVTAAMTPYGQAIMPTSDFFDLLQKTALLALVPAIVGLLKDCLTIFGRLEGKFPLMTGSV